MGNSVARRAAEEPRLRVIALRPEAAALVRRPVTGQGGFQTLFRRIQAGLRGCILRVEERDLDRLVKLSTGAAGKRLGGYQARAEAVLEGVVYWEVCVKQRRRKVLPFDRAPRQRQLAFTEPPE
jgi:hypothetical protein